jgi:hypothetical protein
VKKSPSYLDASKYPKPACTLSQQRCEQIEAFIIKYRRAYIFAKLPYTHILFTKCVLQCEKYSVYSQNTSLCLNSMSIHTALRLCGLRTTWLPYFSQIPYAHTTYHIYQTWVTCAKYSVYSHHIQNSELLPSLQSPSSNSVIVTGVFCSSEVELQTLKSFGKQ